MATVAGAAALLIGGVFLYASYALFDSNEFGERAANALDDERIRDPLETG